MDEFDEHVAKPHPRVDRASLKWDATIIGKDVFMYCKQVGGKGWYLGKITAYDPNAQEHTIVWDDGLSEDWSVNLFAIRKVEEWRFVQPGEDVKAMHVAMSTLAGAQVLARTRLVRIARQPRGDPG